MLNIKVDSSTKISTKELKKKMSPKSQWLKDTGVMTLTIDKATDKRKDGATMQSKDPNWATLMLTCSNTKNQKITHLLKVPLNGANEFAFVVPGKDPDYRPFSEYVSFVNSLGFELEDFSELLSITNHLFGAESEKTLIGRTLDADIQYRGLNIKYMGKDEEGKTLYQLHNWGRPAVLDEATGEEFPVIAGFEACQNDALQKGVKKENISPFPKIKEFLESQNKVSLGVDTQDEEEDESLPF